MASQLAQQIALLIGEVALHEKLSREVVVSRELGDIALDANSPRTARSVIAIAAHGATSLSQLRTVLQPIRDERPTLDDGRSMLLSGFPKTVS